MVRVTEFCWLLGGACWSHPCIFLCLGVLILIVCHCHSAVLSSAVLKLYFSLYSVLSFALYSGLILCQFSVSSVPGIVFCTIRDDDWVLLNSFIPTVFLAVSLQAFAILFQVVSGLSSSCLSTSSLVWRSLRYFWLISESLSLFTSSPSDFLNCLLSLHHSRLIFALTSLWSVIVERLLWDLKSKKRFRCI